MVEKDIIRRDFDRIAKLDTGWDHNKNYHGYLLKNAPKECGKVLEIGCGKGEFSRLMAEKSEHVVGIDLSPEMIAQAKELSKEYKQIEYLIGDVLEYPLKANTYDCIVSLATMHHLPMGEMLIKMREALRPNGTILILDLYKKSSVVEFLTEFIAVPANIVLKLVKTGRVKLTLEEQQAWEEHGKHDHYLTVAEVRRICAEHLPGAKVRRHLFWRYSLIWRREGNNGVSLS